MRLFYTFFPILIDGFETVGQKIDLKHKRKDRNG